MIFAIAALAFLVVLFALMAIVPLLPEVAPAETVLAEQRTQQPLVYLPTDRAQAA